MKKLLPFVALVLSVFIISSCSPDSPPSKSSTLYQVTVTAEPEEGGIVSPEFTEADEGEEIEITATPNENWAFSHWEGDLSGSENPQTILIDADKNITAVFAEDPDFFNLAIQTEGEGSVDVSLQSGNETDGSYQEGSVVELTATEDSGWEFSYWDGDLSGEAPSQTIAMDSDKSVTAVFTQEPEESTFNLAVNIQGDGSVSIDPEQDEYEPGTMVELTASPSGGWEFVEWSGDINSAQASVEITMDSNKEVTAVFAEEDPNLYKLTIQTEGEGSVGVSLQSGNETNGSYHEGSVVELTASADEEWIFSHWEGDLSGDAPSQSITMDSDKTITAIFELREYSLTVNIEGEGTVSEEIVQARTTDYPSGTIVELTATAASGWSFAGWDGDLSGNENPVQIEITGPTEVTAVFTEDTNYFELSVESAGEGSVYEELQSGSESNGSYVEDSVVRLTAAGDEGWSFSHWNGDLSGSTNPETITMDSDKSVTAVFTEESEVSTYNLAVNIQGEGSVNIDPDQDEYDSGTTVELTASPADGWEFTEWTGDINSAQASVEITMDSDKEVTAVFTEEAAETFNLAVNIEGEGSVNIDPEQDDYEEGTTVELTASPADGWEFVEWTGDINSSQASVEITMDSDKEITAVFEEILFDLTINISGNGTVNINPDLDKYQPGTVVELTAEPSDGWEFEQWEGDLTGTENPASLTMESSAEITVRFIEQETAFAGGDGSPDNPYQVSNIDELQRVADYLDAHFVQINDIDASATASWNDGKGFKPIGNFEGLFEGTYDGGRFEISGLTINRGDELYAGLFGFVGMIATIKNIGVVNVSVTGDEYVGGLVGRTYSSTEIENTYATGNVSGNRTVGGLAGRITSTLISNSHAKVEVSGDLHVGGLVGFNGSPGGRIVDSYAEGNVSGNQSVGGLIGSSGRSTSINNTHATGKVTGTGDRIGGLIGHNGYASHISNSFATGDVSGNDEVGGLVGRDDGAGAGNSYATGNVSGNSSLGGLFGQIRAPGGIRDSYASGNVSGVSTLGGLVGNSSHLVHISRSFALGDVSGEVEVGGLIGISTNGRVSDTYAQGNVTGDVKVGGLTGVNDGDGEIATSYASGSVTGNSEVGGLIGLISDEAIIESSYWDSEASGQDDGVGHGSPDGTTGLSTSEMQGTSAQDNMPEFDWNAIWITTTGYPKLRWQD